MNKKKWDALPKDVQNTIEQVNKEWIEKTGKAWDEFDKVGKEFTLAKGNKVIELSKQEDERWAKAVQPVMAEFVKAAKSKGVPGEEALVFCQEWLKKNP
jgi:TRAP-type C4-dicarboxylate transport system substrate-binding protein